MVEYASIEREEQNENKVPQHKWWELNPFCHENYELPTNHFRHPVTKQHDYIDSNILDFNILYLTTLCLSCTTRQHEYV